MITRNEFFQCFSTLQNAVSGYAVGRAIERLIALSIEDAAIVVVPMPGLPKAKPIYVSPSLPGEAISTWLQIITSFTEVPPTTFIPFSSPHDPFHVRSLLIALGRKEQTKGFLRLVQSEGVCVCLVMVIFPIRKQSLLLAEEEYEAMMEVIGATLLERSRAETARLFAIITQATLPTSGSLLVTMTGRMILHTDAGLRCLQAWNAPRTSTSSKPRLDSVLNGAVRDAMKTNTYQTAWEQRGKGNARVTPITRKALPFATPLVSILFRIFTREGDDLPTWNLSAKEFLVARQVAMGYSTKQIAAQENKAYNTIKNQLTAVYIKLGIHERSDLMRRRSAFEANTGRNFGFHAPDIRPRDTLKKAGKKRR